MFSPQAHSQLRKGLGMRLADINSKTMRWHVCTCMYTWVRNNQVYIDSSGYAGSIVYILHMHAY